MDVGHSNSKISTQILIALCFVLVLSAAAFGYMSWQSKLTTDKSSSNLDTQQTQLETAKESATPSSTVSPTEDASPVASSSPTPTQSSELTTFSSTKYKFSFEYPSTWRLQDNLESIGEITLNDPSKTYYFEEGGVIPLIIQVAKDTSNASIDTYLSGALAPLKPLLKSYTKTIGGEKAYIIEGELAPVYHDSRVVFKNGNIYTFSNNIHDIEINSTKNGQEITKVYEIWNNLLESVTFD